MEVKNKYENDVENGTSTLIIKQYRENQLVATYRYIIPIEFTQEVAKYEWNVPYGKITPCITLQHYEQLKQNGKRQLISLNNITPFVRIYKNATYKYAVSSKNKYKYAENDKHLYRTNDNELAINNFIYHIDRLISEQEVMDTEYYSVNFDGRGRKFINIRNKKLADAVVCITGIKYHTLKLNDEKVFGFECSGNIQNVVDGVIELQENFRGVTLNEN